MVLAPGSYVLCIYCMIELNWIELKVDDIYKHQVSKFVFKYIHRITPEQFDGWYKSNFNVNVPSAKTSNYGLKQQKVNGPKIWNKISSLP